jgi:hypothetical protein
MAKLCATLFRKGIIKTLDDVPATLRAQVEQILNESEE